MQPVSEYDFFLRNSVILLQVKFRCKLCGYLYSRKDTLKDHIRGKHNTRFSTQDLNQLVETVTPSQQQLAGKHTDKAGRNFT